MSRQRRGSLSLSCGEDNGDKVVQGQASGNKRSKKSMSAEPFATSKEEMHSGLSTGSDGSRGKKSKKSGFWSNLFRSKIPEKEENEGLESSSSFESVNSIATTNSFAFVSPKKYKGKGAKGKRIPVDDQSLPRGLGGPGSSATTSRARSNGKGGTLNRIGMKIGLKKKYNLQSCESLENIWASPSDRYARREACYGVSMSACENEVNTMASAEALDTKGSSQLTEPEPEASPQMSSGYDSSTWGTNTRKKRRAPAPPSKKVVALLQTSGNSNVIQVPGSSSNAQNESESNVELKSVVRLSESEVESAGASCSSNNGGKKRESFPSGALRRNKSKDRIARPCSCSSSFFAHHSKYQQHRRCGSCDSSHGASCNTNSKTRTHVRGKKKAPPPPNPFGDPDASEETNGTGVSEPVSNIPIEKSSITNDKENIKSENKSTSSNIQGGNVKTPQNVNHGESHKPRVSSSETSSKALKTAESKTKNDAGMSKDVLKNPKENNNKKEISIVASSSSVISPIVGSINGESSKQINVSTPASTKTEAIKSKNTSLNQPDTSKSPGIILNVVTGSSVVNTEPKSQGTSTASTQVSGIKVPSKPPTATSYSNSVSAIRKDESKSSQNSSTENNANAVVQRSVENRNCNEIRSSLPTDIVLPNSMSAIPTSASETENLTSGNRTTSGQPSVASTSLLSDSTNLQISTNPIAIHQTQEIDDEIAQNILNDRQEQELQQSISVSNNNSETEGSIPTTVSSLTNALRAEPVLPSSTTSQSQQNPSYAKPGKIRLFNFSKEKSRSTKDKPQQIASLDKTSSSNVTERDIQEAQNTLEALLHSSGTLKAEVKKVDEQVKAQLGELKKESDKSPLLEFFGAKSKKNNNNINNAVPTTSSSTENGPINPTTVPVNNAPSSPEPSSPSQTTKVAPRPWYKRSISSSKSPTGPKPKIGPKPSVTMLTKFSDLDREAQRIVEENRRKSAEIAFNQNARELISMFSTTFPNSTNNANPVTTSEAASSGDHENSEPLTKSKNEVVPSLETATTKCETSPTSTSAQGQVPRTIFDRPVSLSMTNAPIAPTTSSYASRLSTASTNSYFSQNPRPLSTSSTKSPLEEPKNNVAVVQPQKHNTSIANATSVSVSRPSGSSTQSSTTNSISSPVLSASVTPNVRETSVGVQAVPQTSSTGVSITTSTSVSITSVQTAPTNTTLSSSQTSVTTRPSVQSSATVSASASTITQSAISNISTTTNATSNKTTTPVASYPKQSEPEWTCSRCTLKNFSWRALCEACYTRKDTATTASPITSIFERVNANKPSTPANSTSVVQPILLSAASVNGSGNDKQLSQSVKPKSSPNDNVPSCENFLSQLPSKENFIAKEGKLQGMKLMGSNNSGGNSSQQSSQSVEDPEVEELDIEKLREVRLAFFAKEQQQNISAIIESKPSSQENSMSKPNNLAICSNSSSRVSSSSELKGKNNAKELNVLKANVFSDGEDDSIDSLLQLKTKTHCSTDDEEIKNVSGSKTTEVSNPSPSPTSGIPVGPLNSPLRPWKGQIVPPPQPQGSLPCRFRPMLESISEADSNYYSLMEFDRIYENWQLNEQPNHPVEVNSRIITLPIHQHQQYNQQQAWTNVPSPMMSMQMQSQYYVPNMHFPQPLPTITNQLNILAYEDEDVEGDGSGGRGSSYLESSSQDEHFSNFRPFNAPQNVYPIAGTTGNTAASPLRESDPNFFLRNNYYHYNSPSSSDTEGTGQHHTQNLNQMDRHSNNNRRPRSGGSGGGARGHNYNRNSSAFVNAERQLTYEDYRKLGAIPKGYAYSSSSDSHEERRFSAGGNSSGGGSGFADFSGSDRRRSGARRSENNAQRYNEPPSSPVFQVPGELSPTENSVAVGKLLRKLEWAIAHGEHRLAATLAHDLALLKVNCKVAKPNKDPIMIRIYVEDRFMQQGPFLVQVMQAMTLKDLKCKIETDWGIPSGFQKWILGKRMAEDDHETLSFYEVVHDTMAFLYLVTPQIEKSLPGDNQQMHKTVHKEPHPVPPPLPSKPVNSNNNNNTNVVMTNPIGIQNGHLSELKDVQTTPVTDIKSNDAKPCDNGNGKVKENVAAEVKVDKDITLLSVNLTEVPKPEDEQIDRPNVKSNDKSPFNNTLSVTEISKDSPYVSDGEDSLSQPTPKPRSRTSSSSRDFSETFLNSRKIKEQEKVDTDTPSNNGLKSTETKNPSSLKAATTQHTKSDNLKSNVAPSTTNEKQKGSSNSNKNLLSLQQKLANLRQAAEQAFGKSFGQQGSNLEKDEPKSQASISSVQVKNNVDKTSNAIVKSSASNLTSTKVAKLNDDFKSKDKSKAIEKSNLSNSNKSTTADAKVIVEVKKQSKNGTQDASTSNQNKSIEPNKVEHGKTALSAKSIKDNESVQTNDEIKKTNAVPLVSTNSSKDLDSLPLSTTIKTENVGDIGEPKPKPRIKKQTSENSERGLEDTKTVEKPVDISTAKEEKEVVVTTLNLTSEKFQKPQVDGFCQTTLAFPPPKAPPKQVRNTSLDTSSDKNQQPIAHSSSSSSQSVFYKSPSPVNKCSNQSVVHQSSPTNQSVVRKSPSPTNQSVVHKSPSPTNQSVVHKSASPTNQSVVHKSPSPTNQSVVHKNPSPTNQSVVYKSPSPTHSSPSNKNSSQFHQHVPSTGAAPSSQSISKNLDHNLLSSSSSRPTLSTNSSVVTNTSSHNQNTSVLTSGPANLTPFPKSESPVLKPNSSLIPPSPPHSNTFNKSPTPFISPSATSNDSMGSALSTEAHQIPSLNATITICKPSAQSALPTTDKTSTTGNTYSVSKVEGLPPIQKVFLPSNASTINPNKPGPSTAPQPQQSLTKLSAQTSAFKTPTKCSPSSIAYKSPFFLNASPQKALNSSFNSGISGIISQFPLSSPLRNALPSQSDTQKNSICNAVTSGTIDTNTSEKWPTLQRKNSDSSIINMVIDSNEGNSSKSEDGHGGNSSVDGAGALLPDDKKEDNVQTYLKMLQMMEKQDLITTSEEIECPVCFLQVQPGDGVTLRDCLHNFCKECLIGAVQYAEDSQVKCPFRDNSYSCNSTLQEREIKALVPAEVFEKYLARSVKLAEHKMMNTFHCKTNDCTGWCIFEDDVNVFKCPVCNKRNCLTCAAIHENIDCQQYQRELAIAAETDENAKSSRLMLEKMIQRGEALECPACHVVLLKKWGCDWVRCSYCKTEICWITKGFRWGPGGKGDNSGGCKCGVNGVRCHPKCTYCH